MTPQQWRWEQLSFRSRLAKLELLAARRAALRVVIAFEGETRAEALARHGHPADREVLLIVSDFPDDTPEYRAFEARDLL